MLLLHYLYYKILHFIITLVVMSHVSNTCSVLALEACLCTTSVPMGPHLLNAKDADTEKGLAFLPSCGVTTKAPVKWATVQNGWFAHFFPFHSMNCPVSIPHHIHCPWIGMMFSVLMDHKFYKATLWRVPIIHAVNHCVNQWTVHRLIQSSLHITGTAWIHITGTVCESTQQPQPVNRKE